MLAVQRRKTTMELLSRTDAMSVEDLSAQLEVSLSTVRRDLDELEADGIVRRVHGGAVLVRPVEPDAPELSPDLREVEHPDDKRAIAGVAVGLVKPGSVVLVTGGTTTAALLPLLSSVPDIVVVTNSLDVATRLCATDVDIIVLGGALRRPELSLLGHLVAAAIAELHIDHVITGAFGIDARSGLLGASAQEVETDRHLARSALRLTESRVRSFIAASFVGHDGGSNRPSEAPRDLSSNHPPPARTPMVAAPRRSTRRTPQRSPPCCVTRPCARSSPGN